jgi:adenylosuccinate lyase
VPAFKPIILPEIKGGGSFDSVDPLDVRYFDKEAAKYLSERSRVAYQAYVEAALAQTLADSKICTRSVADEIEKSARSIRVEDVYREEQITKHDIKALINVIKKPVSNKAKPYVHFGATSYDIIATANALQMRDGLQKFVIPRLKDLAATLLNLSEQYADTVQIGRTHGQHAVPITFGFALAEYVTRLGNSIIALDDLSKELKGKFSGAVGAYNALSIFVSKPFEFERTLLQKLDMEPAEYSSQIVPPEGLIRIIDELTIAAGIMANIGHDMRHLQRSEIGEIRERFEKGQTGSSTMAHKRNPWNFENIVSMSKQIIAQCVNANLNITSEHQRDLTDSASSRFYNLALAGVASMAARLNKVMAKLEVDQEAMQRNLKLTGGAVAAEPLYLLFEKYGHISAHEKAKALAHYALSNNMALKDAIMRDEEALIYWQKMELREQRIITEPEKYYTGLASKKTKKITASWKSKLGLV